MWYVDKVLLGEQTIRNKNVTSRVPGTRMSGEMCTSLGNGFSNMIFARFVAHESGTDIIGVVEGDDGLFACNGPLNEKLFEEIGLRIKLESHDELTRASFCGIVCDVESRQVVTDPRAILADFGWIDSRYAKCSERKRRELLKVKALSLAYEYPNCPVISELAYSTLRILRADRVVLRKAIESRSCNTYDRWFLQELSRNLDLVYSHRPTVSESTRVLFEDLYGVSVPD